MTPRMSRPVTLGSLLIMGSLTFYSVLNGELGGTDGFYSRAAATAVPVSHSGTGS
ncbi:hypothetical protein GCM10023405_03820 [Streptomonospora salina]